MESLALKPMDEKTWRKLVLDTANHFGLLSNQIIQDWMGWSLLKQLTKGHENLFVFKGGTSLSQAYQLIDRFSEDIDLAVREVKSGYAFRKNVKSTILSTAKQIGFQVLNLNDIQSDRDFNLYQLGYQSSFSSEAQTLSKMKLEVMFLYPPYPYTSRPITCYLQRYLMRDEKLSLADFNLEPFYMLVQAVERTFVDKLFALCDYHLKNDYRLHSRHLYDLHQLITKEDLNVNLIKELIPKVRKDRSIFPKANPSSLTDTNVKELLQNILQQDVYQSDFNLVTSQLIINSISYRDCKRALLSMLKLLFESK
jgi:predicted nucleotidyltransferase component of viral defense system